MNLTEANVGEEYIIKEICTDDEELDAFLFTLGCYSGEPITVVPKTRKNYVLSIKDGRYNVDSQLAEAIIVQEWWFHHLYFWDEVSLNYLKLDK